MLQPSMFITRKKFCKPKFHLSGYVSDSKPAVGSLITMNTIYLDVLARKQLRHEGDVEYGES